jgi:uncharacterized LabA/DUF88 family protein
MTYPAFPIGKAGFLFLIFGENLQGKQDSRPGNGWGHQEDVTMTNLDSNNWVAVFVDYENLLKSYHRQLHGYHQQVEKYEELDWKTILDFARGDTGRIVIKRAYADWVLFKDKQRELLEHGFELVNTVSRGDKNVADIKIVIDAISVLKEQNKDINNFFLISGDGDFIDLVHHLHASGKIVRGMGVSGTTSNYLTKVCDEFFYYDILVKPTTPEDSSSSTDAAAPPISFDLSEARQILRETLEKFSDGWFSAPILKKAMLKKDPTFNERKYGFAKFKAFLDGHSDMVETRHKTPVRFEVKKVTANGAGVDSSGPEKLLDRYLACLAREKVRMTPTEHRKKLIADMFGIIHKESSEISLTEAIGKLAKMIEETAPFISYTIINDTAHQLFHCSCFDFVSKTKYPEGTMLWDRGVRFREHINNDSDLLSWCDRELLRKIKRCLNPNEKIEPEVAARLLYGKKGNEGYIQELINEIEIQN